jgi:hypothetical protein
MTALQKDLAGITFRNVLVYLSRTDSMIRFVDEKIVKLKGKLFSDLETYETLEAFVIKFICDWEWFIERHIIHLLIKDTSKLSEYLTLTLPTTISYDEGTAILNGTGYFDFKNCSDIKSIAKRILTTQNNSFISITKEVSKNIDDFYVIRNYVAHKSNKSKKTLFTFYNGINIHQFVEPGEYLVRMHHDEIDQKYTYFHYHAFSLFMSAFQMWETLFPSSFEELKENGDFNQNSMQKLINLLSFRKAGQ